ncbi:glycosyltransferase family 61 protein [Halioglobus pacificus]|uniref:glycosyltransferase family 61 protein n=1 Tax=Parahalioglobus pacificus TaxID=930806 RepID=UPI001675A855|nr:glycosyltransferase family 61 protein [Halioglobus pacificus]
MDNYYHFIVDLMLPLSVLVRQRLGDDAITLPCIGSLGSVVGQVYGDRFDFISAAKRSPDSEHLNLLGMNPKIIHCRRNEVHQLRADILTSLALEGYRKPDKLVLIDRAPPPPGALQGSGSLRRSLPNKADIWAALRDNCPKDLSPVHVQLEHLTFSQQVELFYSAKIVIGQHGAGLTNCLWMQPGSAVMEINPYDLRRPHFKILAGLARLEYLTVTQSSEHGAVEPNMVIDSLERLHGSGAS